MSQASLVSFQAYFLRVNHMETIKDTLVVNDKLSVEYEYINNNGEKYVQRYKIPKDIQYATKPKPWGNVYRYDHNGFMKAINVSDKFGTILWFYIDALSDHINGEYYLLSNDHPGFSIWDLWTEHKYEQYETCTYDRSVYSDLIPDDDRYSIDLRTNNDVLFPLVDSNNWTSFRMIHFDIFIFFLYLIFPEYKNDLIRFLKYQPVCTKTTDELFIFNLKQTNKNLLKQLNEANDMISQTNKDCRYRLETAISETKTNLTSEYELKLNQANETHAHEIKSLKEKY